MAHVIPFTPRNASASALLRAVRERSGLSTAEFAAQLGHAVGRPELSPGTLRTWESGTVPPPIAVLEAAQRLARELPQLTGGLTATATRASIVVPRTSAPSTQQASVE